MENLGYLVAAYLILWLGVLAYLLWMGGAMRGLRADLGELRGALQERATDHAEAAETPPATTAEAR